MGKPNKVFAIMILMIAAFQAHAQESIEGIWLTEDGNRKIEIYQKGDYYFGKIVWLEQSMDENGNPVTDLNNPNKELKKRQVLGIDILKDLHLKSGKWHGKIYIPNRGLEMNVVIVGLGKEKLEMSVTHRGFTRKETWTRSTL